MFNQKCVYFKCVYCNTVKYCKFQILILNIYKHQTTHIIQPIKQVNQHMKVLDSSDLTAACFVFFQCYNKHNRIILQNRLDSHVLQDHKTAHGLLLVHIFHCKNFPQVGAAINVCSISEELVRFKCAVSENWFVIHGQRLSLTQDRKWGLILSTAPVTSADISREKLKHITNDQRSMLLT